MKFGKSLNNQIEKTVPQWRDKFLSYKELKKKLKLVQPAAADNERPTKRARIDGEDVILSNEETDFRNSLENELNKFNCFFVEKEEECIIRLKELQDCVAKGKGNSNEQMMQIHKDIVDFHGEMVLLQNYSALNYTGNFNFPYIIYLVQQFVLKNYVIYDDEFRRIYAVTKFTN